MPEGAVYVGRPTKWGNPFKIAPGKFHFHTHEEVVKAYEDWLTSPIPSTGTALGYAAQELRGLDLVCWCALDRPCHADVLLRVANR